MTNRNNAPAFLRATAIKALTGSRLLLISAVIFLSGLDQAWGATSLWKSTAHGRTLYLMGSIHVLQEGHYPLPTIMEEAFQHSDLVVFEVDQQEMESPAGQQLVAGKGLYQNGATLQQNITPSTWQALKGHLQSRQMPVALFQPMKPAYCALVITMMEFERLGFEPRFGLDNYFAGKATRAGKKKAALETAAFQINLFFDLAPPEQERFLKQTLKEMNSLTHEATNMSAAWLAGESDRLHHLLYSSFEEFPDLYERLIIKRNRAWLPQIEEFSQQHQTVLVIVGAGHVVGPHGLLKMLEAKGHSFSQL